MRRIALYIVLLLACSLWAEQRTVPCGTMLELHAQAKEGYHFVQWSDGSTDNPYLFEVKEDNQVVKAIFAINCGVHANWPVEAFYHDWLLMLDVKAIEAKGYSLTEQQVKWYRVQGEPDNWDDENALPDDEEVGIGGYSLSLGDRSFIGTGQYYAVVDLSMGSPVEGNCTGLMRSIIMDYSTPSFAPPNSPRIEPVIVQPNEPQQLVNLNPNEPVRVTISDLSGRVLQRLSAEGTDRLTLQAAAVAGCYQVMIENGLENSVVRYIVVK